MDKNKKAAILRKLGVTAALVALLGLLFAFYYLVYIPRQQSNYNKRAFRVLNEIADNFKGQTETYGTASKNNAKPQYRPFTLSETDTDTAGFRKSLLKNMKGYPEKSGTPLETVFKNDSIYFNVQNSEPDSQQTKHPQKVKSIESIIAPIVDIHKDAFNAMMLVHALTESKPVKGEIIYKSAELNIDRDLIVDSLIEKTAFVSPCIKKVNIEAVNYKLFIFPFRIGDQQFVLGGFTNEQSYKSESQKFPFAGMLSAAILIAVFLCSLPFLKVFLLAPQENITIRDIRFLICMAYVIPFFFMLSLASAAIYEAAHNASTSSMQRLHNDIKNNFYNEIKESIGQLKKYDSIITVSNISTEKLKSLLDNKAATTDLKNILFYPEQYKNLDGIYWTNSNGDDIARWNFLKIDPTYVNKADREFFQQLNDGGGYINKEFNITDTFSIMPTLSKATGEYNVNIAIRSRMATDSAKNNKAVLIGMTIKMYSVTNPVLPQGENFCITDANGSILYHSESARALQENIFKEVDNVRALRLAFKQKNNTIFRDVSIYSKNVKMLVTPLKELPYYIIVYSDKRFNHLFLGHILLFTFFCECLLLLLIAIVTLFFYYSRQKSTQLFLLHNALGFTKPSPSKIPFYKNLIIYHAIILISCIAASVFFTGNSWLYFILNFSVLSPFFSLFGYYLLRSIDEAKVAPQKNIAGAIRLVQHNDQLRNTLMNVIAVYATVIVAFYIIKANITSEAFSLAKTAVETIMVLFEIAFPLLALCIGLVEFPKRVRKLQLFTRLHFNDYITYFLTALLLSILLTSVLPAIGLVSNATNQEKILAVKSRQMFIADGIQQHRLYVNQKFDKTKIYIGKSIKIFRDNDTAYLNGLKFDEGKALYLQGNNITRGNNIWGDDKQCYENSPFYKWVTQFLFLPSEHSHYFFNQPNFYFWNIDSNNTITLHYRNFNDTESTANFSLAAHLPTSISLSAMLQKPNAVYCILAFVIFFICFYKLLRSVTNKVFLVGYFESELVSQQDNTYLEKYFDEVIITDAFELDFWGKEKISVKDVAAKEKAKALTTSSEKEAMVLKIQTLLQPVYDKIWNDLAVNPQEQFVLYDFATDGFTNYKNADVLYKLFKKGLLKKEDHNLIIFNQSFENYLVNKKGSKTIDKLTADISAGGRWGNFRNVFLVLLLAVIIFLFIVQEDTSKRLIAIVTALATLVPLMLKLFDSGNTQPGEAAKK